MNVQKLINILGIAQKAGKIASGEIAVEKAVKSRKVRLMILATDAAENSKKNYLYIAKQLDVPVCQCLTKLEIGSSIGKHDRSAMVIIDNGFAQSVLKIINVLNE